jgi:hypothetical protein
MIKESLLRVDNVDGNIVDFLMTVPKRKREDDENAWSSSSSFNQHDDDADADDCKYTNTFISNKRFAFYSCDTELREEGPILDCVVSPTALVSIFRQTSPQSTTISLEVNNNESNNDDSSSSSDHPEFSTIARARTISETDSTEEYEKLYFSNDPPDMNSISSRPTSPLLDEPRQLQLVY